MGRGETSATNNKIWELRDSRPNWDKREEKSGTEGGRSKQKWHLGNDKKEK